MLPPFAIQADEQKRISTQTVATSRQAASWKPCEWVHHSTEDLEKKKNIDNQTIEDLKIILTKLVAAHSQKEKWIRTTKAVSLTVSSLGLLWKNAPSQKNCGPTSVFLNNVKWRYLYNIVIE